MSSTGHGNSNRAPSFLESIESSVAGFGSLFQLFEEFGTNLGSESSRDQGRNNNYGNTNDGNAGRWGRSGSPQSQRRAPMEQDSGSSWFQSFANPFVNGGTNANQNRRRSDNNNNNTNNQRAPTSRPNKSAQEKELHAIQFAGCKFETWSIKELKAYLDDHQLDYSTCVEKNELAVLCRTTTWPLPPETEEEHNQCTICCHYKIDAVLSKCGHQFCSVCTFKMCECPMCKAPIQTRIRTFR